MHQQLRSRLRDCKAYPQENQYSSQHFNPHISFVTSAIETTFQIQSQSYKLGHRNILKYLKQEFKFDC